MDLERWFNELTHKYIEYRTRVLISGKIITLAHYLDEMYRDMKNDGLGDYELSYERLKEFSETLSDANNEFGSN